MGVQWDSRSIEFRLLFNRYNKQLNYFVNKEYIKNGFLGTIASASANSNIADKVFERIKKLHDQQDTIVDQIMYGSIKKAKVKSEAASMEAKLAFLIKARTKEFKSL